MFSRLSRTAWLVSSLLLIGSAQAQLELSGPDQPVPPPPTATAEIDAATSDLPEGAEVMVTGPLHEAFAEQFSDRPEPGIVISRQPPEVIDEIPPEYRPDGQDIVWIPGYWGWDPEREDFLWITGIWRQAPPDRNWVPGYWAEVSEGFQWIAGFWALSETQEIRYLPPPPEPLAAEPSAPAPSQEHFWIPGQWNYVNNDYQWRAGYWTVGYPDWVWVPDRYVWTPLGCIFRPGYWDYVVQERGTVFCPIYWSRPVVNYQFRPSYVVSTGPTLLANLFAYPRYHHYFFGNYYSSRYLNQSIYPWVTYGQQSRRYDPLYGYYRTQYRDNDYLNRLVRLHNYYSANVAYQPPRTLNAQFQHQHDFNDRYDLAFHATRINQLVRNANINSTNINSTNINSTNINSTNINNTNITNTNINNSVHHHMQFVKLADNERQQIQRSLDPAKQIWKQRAEIEGRNRPNLVDGQRPDGNNRADGNPDKTARNNDRGPTGKGDGQDRRWNLPKADAGARLGSVALGQTGSKPNDRDNANRNGRRSEDRAEQSDPKVAGRPDLDRDGSADNTKRDTNRDGIVDGRDTRKEGLPGRTGNEVPGRDGLSRDGLNRDGLNRDGLNRDGLNRDGLGRDGLGRDGLGRDGLGRDGLGRDGLGRDGLGRDGLGRDASRDALNRDALGRDTNKSNDGNTNRDPLNRDPLNRDANRDGTTRNPLDRNPLDGNPLNRDPATRDPKGNGIGRDAQNRAPLNRDPQNRLPLNRDPLNQGPLSKDPLNRDPNRGDLRNVQPGQPRDRQPGGLPGNDRRNPLENRVLPGSSPSNTPNSGRAGGATPATPENRNPLSIPGRGSGDNNARTPRNVPGNAPVDLPSGSTKTLPSPTPGTSSRIPNPPGNPGLNNRESNERNRTPRINPSQPSIAPGEPNPSAPRRGGNLPGNIQSDLQKMREMNQRRPEPSAPRRAPQAPKAEKNDKGDKKDK